MTEDSPHNELEEAALDLEGDDIEIAYSELIEEKPTADQAQALAYDSSLSDGVNGLRKLARDSDYSPNQAAAFTAAVELDLLKEANQRLGIQNFFEICCEHANSRWLNPMTGIHKLQSILTGFRGDSGVLVEFIKLLKHLAARKVDPSAFLRYVMSRRLHEDFNWRKWEQNHLQALQIIADKLIEMRGQPPFDQEWLGDDNVQVFRDVVLVKYFGQPLAFFTEEILSNQFLMRDYKEAWQSLELDNFMSIIFLKQNLLPLVYHLSGKVDFQHLSSFIKQIPDIEEAFKISYPPESFHFDFRELDINLYDRDTEQSFKKRKAIGFLSYDFITEMHAYLNILKALMATQSGIYLCSFFARKLTQKKDPVIATALARLVELVDDRGGKHIYIWHVKQLLSKDKESIPAYLEYIAEHDGCDPDYPDIRDLFSDTGQKVETSEVWKTARTLGIDEAELLKVLGLDEKTKQLSFRDLIRAYSLMRPEYAYTIQKFQTEFSAGGGRNWDIGTVKSFDALDDLHRPLLRSVIKGIGYSWGYNMLKSSSFKGLLSKYGRVNSTRQPFDSVEQFTIPVKDVGSIDLLKQQEIRKQINFKSIQDIWQVINDSVTDTAVDQFVPLINQFQINLNRGGQATQNRILNQEEDLKALHSLHQEYLQQETHHQSPKVLAKIKSLEKEIKKNQKALHAIHRQQAQLENVLSHFHNFSELQKLIIGIIISAKLSRGMDELAASVLKAIVARYQQNEFLKDRLDYLRQDIAIQLLTYQQFQYMLNTLEAINYLLQSDTDLKEVIQNAHEDYARLLVPYLNTRQKVLTLDAVESSFFKLCAHNKLSSERAKWQGLNEQLARSDSKYFRKFNLYVSRSFMDSYYGDMGGICLAGRPQAILHPGFFNIRLVDQDAREILGMGLVFLSNKGIPSLKIKQQWFAFAFNPLASLVGNMTGRQQLFIYLHYRLILESIVRNSGVPMVLPGIATWGIVSNNGSFADLIKDYERNRMIRHVHDAAGLELYYDESAYANAFLMIHPEIPASFHAEKTIQKINF